MSDELDRAPRPKLPTKGRQQKDFTPKEPVVPAGTNPPKERPGYFRGARVKSRG
jgi:hypothetical protein